jgi:homoserine dehydrogenase
MVAPFMIDDSNPLYSVNGVLNGILVKGNVLGDVMFYGSGAGKLPTASAVVSDVVDAAKHKNTHIMQIWSDKKLELSDIKNASSKFFVRLTGSADARFEEAEKNFGSITVLNVDGVTGEFGFVTEEMTEAEYETAAEKTEGIITRIRVE